MNIEDGKLKLKCQLIENMRLRDKKLDYEKPKESPLKKVSGLRQGALAKFLT